MLVGVVREAWITLVQETQEDTQLTGHSKLE